MFGQKSVFSQYGEIVRMFYCDLGRKSNNDWLNLTAQEEQDGIARSCHVLLQLLSVKFLHDQPFQL